jgi:hypothetical protein
MVASISVGMSIGRRVGRVGIGRISTSSIRVSTIAVGRVQQSGVSISLGLGLSISRSLA